MTAVKQTIKTGAWIWPFPQIAPQRWLTLGHQRLDHILDTAAEIPFDDTSKIVFFSDVHRSDKSDSDEFAPNQALFINALRHYYHHGFTYIELGDGDDLWRTRRFSDIFRAYPDVFRLLHQFKWQNRLHLIAGNHEIQGQQYQRVQKGDLETEAGLVLRHTQTGQRLFVVHGHQVDVWCDQLSSFSRPAVGLIYWFLDLLGMKNGVVSASPSQTDGMIVQKLSQWYRNQQAKLTQQLIDWARNKRQLLISGHTHLPMFAVDHREPYFNTGCCVNPGYITGIEIQNASITLVKWFVNGAQRYEQTLLAPARKLSLFA